MTTFNAATPYVQKQMAALSENTAMYLYMASNGIDVNALATMTPNTTGYEEMVTSLNNLGLAFPEAQRYAQDFIEETETGILSLIQVFGDLTGEILEGSKAWKGTDRERFSAAKEMNSSIVTYAEGNYYRGKYAEAVANGTLADLPDFVVDWVVNQTGYTKDQVRANRNNEVSNMLNMASLSESETAESQATELSQFLTENSTLLNVLLTAGAQDPNGKIVVTDALISQVTAAKGAGAAEWAMFLSQVQNHGGSVSMTPVTYQDTTGEEVVDKTVYQITVDGVTKEISADDYAYRVSKEDKYGFGITSADAPGNKLATARTIGAALQTPGGISTWMTGKDKDTIAGLTGVFESLPKLAHLGKLVTDGSGGKLTIFDIADPTKAAQVTEILKAAGYTARDAEEAIEAYNNELLYEGIRAADTYGDSTEDVIANMEQLAGSAEEAAEAFHDLFDAMYQLDDLDALIALWNAGSRSDFVVSGVAKAIGMDESHVRDPNNANVVTSRLTAERALLAADYSAEVSAYDQYLTPDVLRMLGVPAGGSVEFTSAQLQGRIHKLTSTNPIAADKLQGLAEMMQVSGDTLTITADTVSAPSTPIAVDGTVGNISANAGRFTVNKANPVASEADLWFAGLTDQVNGIQVTGLTNYQGYLGAGKLWNKTGSGGFRAFFDGANPEVKSAMLNMTENAGWYSYLSYGIESKGLKDNKGNLLSANSLLTLQEGTAEYTAMESAVADLG